MRTRFRSRQPKPLSNSLGMRPGGDSLSSWLSRCICFRDAYYVVKTGTKNYADLKDVLAPALGLLGTVIGYYYGRVPAERHADTARDAANAAHERELRVRQQVHAGLADIQQKHNRTKEGAGTDTVNDAINLLRSSL